jgi:hypothetical protein
MPFCDMIYQKKMNERMDEDAGLLEFCVMLTSK